MNTEQSITPDDWKPGHWFRIMSPDGKLWMETSIEGEAREEAERTGWPLERLWVLQKEEWRPDR